MPSNFYFFFFYFSWLKLNADKKNYKKIIKKKFCKNFRVGERCCEFECLDPPGEDNKYQVSRYDESYTMQVITTNVVAFNRNVCVNVLKF